MNSSTRGTFSVTLSCAALAAASGCTDASQTPVNGS